MYRGVVSGTVVATVKESHLDSIPLLVVRKIENGVEKGLIVAVDHTRQAGYGDHVFLVGSKEAARIFRTDLLPVDAAIIGFIDTYNEEL